MIVSTRPFHLSLLVFSLGLLVLVLASGAQAQDAPLVVEGDQVTYDQATQLVEAAGNVRLRYRGIRLSADRAVFDLRRELLTAEGHVVLVDASGRELRGDALTYDVRLNLAEMRRAETIVDRLYVRSEQIRQQPGLITATEAMLTPCDPARPAVRITAQRIEVRPGDRLVASRATLWVGRFRLLTLPVYVVSLRTAEETARSFPRVGYNSTDGLWVEYVYGYQLASLPGALFTKYGTRTGLIVRNTLTYRRPPWSLELTVGRNQDRDMQVFDLAEVMLTQADQRLGSLPVFYTLRLGSGWFAESTTGVRTSRTRYAVGLSTASIPIAPRTSFQGALSWSEAFYGTGARQAVPRADLGVTHAIDARQSLSLSYSLLEVLGGTPFAFDTIAEEDRVNRVTFLYARSGERAGGSTGFRSGLGYNFRDRTPFVILGYGERVAARYHWSLTAEYNLTTTDTKLIVDAGLAVGHGTYATVQATYHTLSGVYDDLDFIVTSRLCDCVDVSLKYRQVRQEIWLEIGLAAFPQSRLQLQFQGP